LFSLADFFEVFSFRVFLADVFFRDFVLSRGFFL
jgi:hypothetical protein